MNGPSIPAFLLKPSGEADPVLPAHARLGAFEIRRVLARGAATVVYLATDHALAMPVAIQEYLPARLVRRRADGQLHSVDARHDEALERGLQAFIGEARMLAHCDHPALVRVLQLLEANGTAYRVMPYYTGQRLVDLRRHMVGAPDEASLRSLLDALLGALETIHRSGQSHGGLSASNILLLSDDRPLLLGPGVAAAATGSDLVEALMSSVTAAREASVDELAAAPSGVAADLYAVADVMRYCISGEPAPAGAAQPTEPLATTILRRFEPLDRPHYSAALLDALDAAASPLLGDRPISAGQFRSWVDGSVPHGRRLRVAPTTATPPVESTTEPSWDRGEPAGPPLPAAAEPIAAAAPPLSPKKAPRAAERWKQWLLGGALAALSAGLIAFATGAWDLMPALPSERPTASGTDPFVPLGPPAATREAMRVTPDRPATGTEPDAAVSHDADTAVAAREPAAPSPAAAVASAPSATTEVVPATATAPPEAKVTTTKAPAVSSRSRAEAGKVQPVGTAAAGSAVAEPRAACAGKTEFAMYRCMQAQCRTARWASHPQCVRLRHDDEVG